MTKKDTEIGLVKSILAHLIAISKVLEKGKWLNGNMEQYVKQGRNQPNRISLVATDVMFGHKAT